MSNVCRICQTRRPRRSCPAAQGEICAPCCGEQREVTLDCPFDCPYLEEARKHDKLPPLDPRGFPNADVRVTDEFLRAHEPLVFAASQMLFEAAMAVDGVNDHDVREALAALIQTRRTRQSSGLIYDSRPENPLAAAVQRGFSDRFAQWEQTAAERGGNLGAIRDADMLGVLVFLQRLELQNNTGRRKSRAFLDFLRGWFAAVAAQLK